MAKSQPQLRQSRMRTGLPVFSQGCLSPFVPGGTEGQPSMPPIALLMYPE